MARIRPLVESALSSQPVLDMHTHLYPPAFGTPVPNASGEVDPHGLMLWGVDELLTYHYLVAEVFRVVPATTLPYESFWRMPKTAQAEHIWRHLFVERTPISEACRGVVTTLTKLGLDPSDKDLSRMRKWFAQQDPGGHIDRVMELGNVSSVTMTNPVFDDNERGRWLKDATSIHADGRFRAVLRIDPLLRDWPTAARKMSEWGFACDEKVDDATVKNARRFLEHWIDRQRAIYLAVSLPPEFRYPSGGASDAVFEEVILPVCVARKLPFAMMIGSKLRVNPALADAGDMVGKSDVASVVNLCRAFPHNKFFVTMLAREDQHELAVAARKFGNLMVFGCWWFLNNPSLVDEVTRMRLELLGTSFIPQHSDARVLDQLVYKWDHSRAVIGRVLTEKYEDLARAGWPVTEADVRADVKRLLADNFTEFLAR
jgi:hypothetical protein